MTISAGSLVSGVAEPTRVGSPLVGKEVSFVLMCTNYNAVYFGFTRREFRLFGPDLALTRLALFRFLLPLPFLLFRVFLFWLPPLHSDALFVQFFHNIKFLGSYVLV